MKVYIYGYNGNMARRYRAILSRLGHEAGGEDLGTIHGFSLAEADAVIVATPTDTHARLLMDLRDSGKPILCEKPITKRLDELEHVLQALKGTGTKLQMVSQYDYLVDDDFEGPTVYDYFKSGSDGLYWDCINIIKHARDYVRVSNDSPVWKCMINGQKLNIGLMDRAYIEMIKDWLANLKQPTDYAGIWRAHKKVHDLEAKWLAS